MSLMNYLKRTTTLSIGSALLFSGLFSVSLSAQEQTDQKTETQEIEEIVVTGSRIPRPDMVANSPINVITSEEFELTTTLEVDELLNNIPQIMVPSGASTNSEGGGNATISLRNLGAKRTLILINGRRVVGSATSGVVDINGISPALIERVEVVTGGASAVYGSDAMAGVVNFITKRDFEGVMISGQYGVTQKGDSAKYGFDFTMGMNSADDRGNLIMNVSYFKRDRTLASERDFSRDALDEKDGALVLGGSTTVPQSIFRLRGAPAFDPFGDLTPSNGRFIFSDDGQDIRGFKSPEDKFNFNEFVNLQLPLERWTVASLGHYDISENIEVFAEANFSSVLIDRRRAPTPLSTVVDDFSLSNPYMSQAIYNFLSPLDDGGATDNRGVYQVAGDGIISLRNLRHRTLEAGPRLNVDKRTTFRIVTGLRGEFDNGMNWEAYYNYGKHERVNSQKGGILEDRIRQGLLLNAAGDACQDTSQGCVPLNVFGLNSLDQEMVDFISFTAVNLTDIVQQQAALTLGGVMAELDAGPLGYSVGVEWHSESADFRPDQTLQSQQTDGFSPTNAIQGEFSVKEAFGEVNIPIFSGVAGAEYFGIEAGARVSDYSNDVGTIFTYKIGGEWRPIADLKIRGLFQEATRAPNINELFRSRTNSSQEATDMCTGGSKRAANAALDAYCDAQNVPDDFEQANNQINVTRDGNPNLFAETSTTWTLGMIYTPEAIPGLLISADYYSIKITDAITAFGGGLAGTFASCEANPVTGNPFCDVLVRDSDGEIDDTLTILPNANASMISTKGIDFVIDYSWDLGGDWGSLQLHSSATYVFENIIENSPLVPAQDCAGLVATRGVCGEGDPYFRAVTDLTHRMGKLTTRLQYRYVGGITNEILGFARQSGLPDPELGFSSVGAEHYFGAFFKYDINDNYSVNFNVRNLFDNQPPIIGDAGGEPNIDSQLHDPFGRRFTVSFKAKF